MTPAGAALFTLLAVAAGMFGFRRAVARRARSDYRTTKAAVKPLRNAYWLSLWRTVQPGAAIVIILAILLAWAARDARNHDPPPPRGTHSPSTTPPRRRSHSGDVPTTPASRRGPSVVSAQV